ncbi:hypothetical protein RRK14_003111 [Escherichia coli]|nr:hypothetical protein [Escherichia coli]
MIFRVASGGLSKSHPFHCVVCGSKYGSVYARLLLPSCSEGFKLRVITKSPVTLSGAQIRIE